MFRRATESGVIMVVDDHDAPPQSRSDALSRYDDRASMASVVRVAPAAPARYVAEPRPQSGSDSSDALST